MIKKIISSLCCSLLITNGYTDTHPDLSELIQKNREQANFAGVLKQLQDNRATYQDEPLLYYSSLADYESFLGLYKQALVHDDQSSNDDISTQTIGKSAFEKYQFKNAKEVILQESQSHQIIFINEAHHSPQHRAFTLSLLQDLYNQGFRYLAAETFDETDDEVNQRGYPLALKTGYYTDEPIYGELVRAARKIGYQIIAYEDTSAHCDPLDIQSAADCIDLRERGQAKKLYDKVIKSHPNAKLLVHAGYGHIAKLGFRHFTPMAVYFEQLTGISPYSIDQTTMSEHSHPDKENAIYKEIVNSGKLKSSGILFNEEGALWSPFGPEKFYDLIVFHPRTVYKNNRPTWLFHIEGRIPLVIPSKICKNTFPCVIEAFNQNETVESVPIDRFLITKKQSITLALMPGIYMIRTKNVEGEVLSAKQITVIKKRA